MKLTVYLILCCFVSENLCLLTPQTDSTAHITEVLNNLTKRIDVLENENHLLKQKISVSSHVHPGVSFTVQAGADIKQLGANQPIVFKSVIAQEGHSYDARTGVFTCPIPGTYLFTASILNNPPVATTRVIISKNGGNGVPIHCSHSTGLYNQCSATLITHLVVGDEVWVKHIGGGETDNWSSFAGALLRSD